MKPPVERISLKDLQAYVGAPSAHGAVYSTQRGPFALTAWEHADRGRRGWWCAISLGTLVLTTSWTPGGRFERDQELATQLRRATELVDADTERSVAS